MFPKVFWKRFLKVIVRSKALCDTQHKNLIVIVSKQHWYTGWLIFSWLEGDSTFIVHTYIQYICIKPKETNHHNSTFSVIVLAWAGLVNHPATVLHLSSVVIPGKVLSTEAISVQRLSFTVSFYPLGRAETLGLFKKCCLRSKRCSTAVNVLPHLTLGFRSGTAWVIFIIPTAGLTETRTGVVHSIDRHAGMFNEKVFHRTCFHFDSG